MKNSLARQKMNISADILEKAVLLPEDDIRDDLEKNYPRIG